MFVQEFPDITWLRAQIDTRFANRKGWNNTPLDEQGWPTVIMNAKASKEDRRNLKGPFSIFTNISGNSIIGTDTRQTTISPLSYALTNDQENYDLIIDSNTPIETANIHFGYRFYLDALKLHTCNLSNLLDDPFHIDQENLSLKFGSTFRDSHFDNLLDLAMREQKNQNPEETALFNLFSYVLGNQNLNRSSLKTVKASTKTELESRLQVAIDYIHNHYNQEVQLSQLCKISCLSKFHLIRTFKEYVGYSPYQYLKTLRLQKALEYLRETNLHLTEIAWRIGLENASSLSRMIKQSTGFYPRQLEISNFGNG